MLSPENGEFTPAFKSELVLMPKDFDPSRVIQTYGTRCAELYSGGSFYDISATVDPQTEDFVAAMENKAGNRISRQHLPHVAMTENGLLFTIGSKHPLVLTQDKGVFLNDDELKEMGMIKRNFRLGRENPEMSRYFYEIDLRHGSLGDGILSDDEAVKITAGVEFSTLNFSEIWGIIEAMKRENLLSDQGIRTLVMPYFKVQPVRRINPIQ